ncbi:MAG: hypothetical protein KIT83_08130 [Bryobacterales bacterium]|nr:hypothetical protein [Bryobacterales bacterium]
MNFRYVLLIIGMLGLATLAPSRDRVIGLLTLPEVFGDGPCDRFSPRELPLYASPKTGKAVGSIQVVSGWTFPPEGGCSGLEVAVRLTSSATLQPLPTSEVAYEAPAAVVLEARGHWYKVRLAEGSAWVRAVDSHRFHQLERLIVDSLTYMTEAWDGQLTELPAKPGRAARLGLGDARPPARVVRSTRVKGTLWFYVELMNHSMCDAGADPQVVDRGWVAAHGSSGEPSVWFFSRGC